MIAAVPPAGILPASTTPGGYYVGPFLTEYPDFLAITKEFQGRFFCGHYPNPMLPLGDQMAPLGSLATPAPLAGAPVQATDAILQGQGSPEDIQDMQDALELLDVANSLDDEEDDPSVPSSRPMTKRPMSKLAVTARPMTKRPMTGPPRNPQLLAALNADPVCTDLYESVLPPLQVALAVSLVAYLRGQGADWDASLLAAAALAAFVQLVASGRMM